MSLKDEMMSKKTWAVVGATDDKSRFGYKIPVIMDEHNYEVFLVNPTKDEIDGKKVYKSLDELPKKVDVIDMIVNPKFAKGYVDKAKELGIENIFFQPGSYDDELVEYTKNLGLNVVLDCVYATLKN